MTPQVDCVEVKDEYHLLVHFSNGESRLFDLTPYLHSGVFQELQDLAYFRQVRVIFGGIGWPHEQDLSADTLYLRGEPITSAPAERAVP